MLVQRIPRLEIWKLPRTHLAVLGLLAVAATFAAQKLRVPDLYVDASVGESGSGLSWDSPFATLQEAVDVMGYDGVVIHVRPGVYEPPLFDNMYLFNPYAGVFHFTFESTDGPGATFIDGGGAQPCYRTYFFELPEFGPVFRGFTMVNGRGSMYSLTLDHCVVSNCVGETGTWNEILSYARLEGSLVVGNRGWIVSSWLRECTVADNEGCLLEVNVRNSIISGNIGYDWWADAPCTNFCFDSMSSLGVPEELRDCLVFPAVTNPAAVDVVTNPPCFVSGSYRLEGRSPARGRGLLDEWVSETDLDGKRRVQGGCLDLGCYQFGSGTAGTTATTPVAVPHAWLDACTNLADDAGGDYEVRAFRSSGKRMADGTFIPLWQEYVQGTDPNDSNDVFRVSLTTTNGVVVSWSPDLGTARRYTLHGTDALTNRVWAATNVFDDVEFLTTNRFFKVGVDWQ